MRSSTMDLPRSLNSLLERADTLFGGNFIVSRLPDKSLRTAVMIGVKIGFPGSHLHPDDLLDLIQLEPPTLSLGVPTIWLGLIQDFERAQVETTDRWKHAFRHALPGRRGVSVPESLIRAFAHHGVWLLQG